jgi:hypothetical protein
VVVAILAGQVIGHGRVISDWANAAAGSSSMDEYRLAVVIFSAGLVALAGTAAAAATEGCCLGHGSRRDGLASRRLDGTRCPAVRQAARRGESDRS